MNDVIGMNTDNVIGLGCIVNNECEIITVYEVAESAGHFFRPSACSEDLYLLIVCVVVAEYDIYNGRAYKACSAGDHK